MLRESALNTVGGVVIAGGVEWSASNPLAVLSWPLVLEKSASSTVGRVVAAGGVGRALQHRGRVIAAAGVGNERVNTIGRVVDAGGVAKERAKTGGRVVVAGCVLKECINTMWPCCGHRLCYFKSAAKPFAVLLLPLVLLIRAHQNRWPCCRCQLCCLERAKTVGRVAGPPVLLTRALTPVAVFSKPVCVVRSALKTVGRVVDAVSVGKSVRSAQSRWPCWRYRWCYYGAQENR